MLMNWKWHWKQRRKSKIILSYGGKNYRVNCNSFNYDGEN